MTQVITAKGIRRSGKRYQVFLDGKMIDCKAINAKRGLAIVYCTNEDGRHYLEVGKIARKLVRGSFQVVEIVR